jgi:prepilin-type N-terminal cleavage/methylation domain-containing protein
MRRDRGFTVLELLVALGIAAVLTGSGVASLVDLVATARVAGAARAAASGLRLAREQALARGAAIEVRFDAPARAWTTRTAGGAVIATHALPRGVAFARLPARGRVLFGGLGTAENATVAFATGPRQRSVIVNQRGRVRVQ